MKAKEFKGIIPPIQTAFTASGELDKEGTRNIVRFTLPHVHAYYPLGTYGSGPLMTPKQRMEALEIMLEEANGKAPIIAHVGAADTKTAVELAKHAKKAGAAGIGSISPYYSPNLPDDLLFHYFMDLMDAVNEEEFPVFLYNNAHYCQNTVSPALLKRLADEGLRGCKDSSFDLVNFYLYQDAVKEYEDFNIIIGTEAIFVAAFESGATGCVCGIGNIYPDLLRKMYDEFEAGCVQDALETQSTILKVRSITKQGPTLSLMHAILELRGVEAGMPKRPYLPVSDEKKQDIKRQLEALGLL